MVDENHIENFIKLLGAKGYDGKLTPDMMIEENHIKTFVKQLAEKGYSGKFFFPNVGYKEVAQAIHEYLQAKNHELDIALPVWASTVIDGDLMSDERTMCLMKVDFRAGSGLDVNLLKAIRMNGTREIYESIPLTVPSMAQLPDRKTINALIPNRVLRRKSRRRKL